MKTTSTDTDSHLDTQPGGQGPGELGMTLSPKQNHSLCVDTRRLVTSGLTPVKVTQPRSCGQ